MTEYGILTQWDQIKDYDKQHNDHHSVSPGVNTSGSEISSGPSPCMHLFAANQAFKNNLKRIQCKPQEPITTTHVEHPWSFRPQSGKQWHPWAGRVFLHLVGCCAKAHFYGTVWGCSPCRLDPLVIRLGAAHLYHLLDYIYPDGEYKTCNSMLSSK